MTYSIFRKKSSPELFYRAYDDTMQHWAVPYEDVMVATRFGETHVIVSGPIDAAPLVLFHCMTFSATIWYSNIESLTSQYRVYAVDTMGDFGKSTMTSVLKSKEDAWNWIHDVLQGLDIPSAILLGHSMGGWLALNFAIRSPERVTKLILLAPAAGIHKITPKFFLKIYPALAFPSEKRIRREIAWFTSHSYRPDERAETLIRQFVVSGLNCMPQLRVIPSVFSESELRNFPVQTLVMVGDEEVIYDYRSMLARAKRLIPNLKTRVCTGVAHGLPIEQSFVVNETVMDFLVQ